MADNKQQQQAKRKPLYNIDITSFAPERLEDKLNARAQQGWTLGQILPTVNGYLVVFVKEN